MHIYKFTLPEGCDLTLRKDGAIAEIWVSYDSYRAAFVCDFLLGEDVKVRRGIGGTTFVVNNRNPLYAENLVERIRSQVFLYKRELQEKEELTRSMNHLPEYARRVGIRSYAQTAQRIQEGADLRTGFLRGMENIQISSAIPENRMFVFPSLNEVPSRSLFMDNSYGVVIRPSADVVIVPDSV